MVSEQLKPDVSVCIANYNGERIISQCIDSGLKQKTQYSIEIIVHDDASVDSSIDVIENNFPQLKLIKSDCNVGYCISNNRMVDEASGKFILLLNNDAELYEDAVETLVELSNIDQFGIATLPQYTVGSEGHSELFNKGMFLDVFMNPMSNFSSNYEDVHTVMGALLFIRKDFWFELGGFPTWFESLAEDLYICLFTHLYGRRVLVAGSSGFLHRVGYSFGGGNPVKGKAVTSMNRRIKSERNKTFCICIFYPWYLLIPVLIIS